MTGVGGRVSPVRALIEGLGLHLEQHGIGVWTVPDDAVEAYPPGAVAIVANKEPAEPLNCIILNVTTETHDPVTSGSVYGFQVRCRVQSGDPLTIDDLSYRIWDALHSLHAMRLPTGFPVRMLTHRSSVSLETTRDDLWWRSDNYQVVTNVASTHRA